MKLNTPPHETGQRFVDRDGNYHTVKEFEKVFVARSKSLQGTTTRKGRPTTYIINSRGQKIPHKGTRLVL